MSFDRALCSPEGELQVSARVVKIFLLLLESSGADLLREEGRRLSVDDCAADSLGRVCKKLLICLSAGPAELCHLSCRQDAWPLFDQGKAMDFGEGPGVCWASLLFVS